MPKAFLNGNFHLSDDIDLVEAGIKYLGDGNWNLPDDAIVTGGYNDDWVITFDNGMEVYVYTEE